MGEKKLGLKVKSIVSGHNHDRKLSVIRTGSQFRNTPLGRLIIIQIYDEDIEIQRDHHKMQTCSKKKRIRLEIAKNKKNSQ